METAKQRERTTRVDGGPTAARRSVSTKVRTRCSPRRSKEEVVRKEMHKAAPFIVRANIEKAKEGSLSHTKWLWGVADKAKAEVEQKAASLAEILLAEMEGAGLSSPDRRGW